MPQRPGPTADAIGARSAALVLGRIIRRTPVLCAFALAGLLTACLGESSADPAALAVIDTLPGGAVRVRSSAVGLWDADPEARWRLVEEVRIGRADGTGPEVFGSIGSIVEDPLGRVWIADPMAGELRIFDRSGSHVRTVGRQGSGPGEFERLAVVLIGPDGNIWADDGRLRRWEVFDTAGVRVAGHPGNSNVGGGVRAWTEDGRLLEVNVQFTPGGGPLDMRSNLSARRLLPDGSLVPEDSLDLPALPEPESVHFGTRDHPNMNVKRLPLGHHAVGRLMANGDFWVTEGGGAYAIRRQTADGDTLLMIEREFEPVPASTEVLALAAEELVPPEGMTSNDNDRSRLPDVRPPFEDFFPATDGVLWVRRAFASDSVGFDVFAADGRYLGRPETVLDVADLRIALVTPDRIYAVARDEMDVQSVVIFRIEKP